MNESAFARLVESFEKAYEAMLDQEDATRKEPRKRRRGSRRKAVLQGAADKLLFLLFYYKFYPTQEVQGFFFGMGKAQANEWIKRLTPLVERALGYELQLPARQSADVARVLAQCPELSFILGGTQRPIQRPKDPERQRRCYSGKKKRRTLNNLLVSEKKTKKLKALSATVEGKQHDKAPADATNYPFPVGSLLYKNTGFQGYEPMGITTRQPKKKPRGKALTEAEKAQNRKISREPIGIEHSLAGVKVYRIVKEVLRQHLEGFADVVMAIACGLHNLRIDHRHMAAT